MKKQLIFSVIVLIVTIILVNIPYAETAGSFKFQNSHPIYVEKTLFKDFISENYLSGRLVLLSVFFPFVFSVEIMRLPKDLNLWQIGFLALQGVVMSFATFLLWFVMVFNLFEDRHQFKFSTYLITSFMSVFALWSILLSIPFFDRFKVLRYFMKDHSENE